MIRSIIFVSRSVAEKMRPLSDTVMISIHDNEEGPARIRNGFRWLLRLEFDDVTEATKRIPEGALPDARPDGLALCLRNEQFPDANHAQAIVKLVNHFAAEKESVDFVVHCQAGISRSAAVAQFVADKYSVPIDNANLDTSGANRRLLRLLNKVSAGDALDIREVDVDSLVVQRKQDNGFAPTRTPGQLW